MGKYTNVAARLTPKPQDQKFQSKVDAVKRDIAATSTADLAKGLIACRAEKDAAKQTLSDANVRVLAYEQRLADAFEEAGVSTIKLESGESVSTQIRTFARVKDPALFRAWCIAHGLENALTLPWQSTNALAAERLVEGLPDPDGVETHKQTIVVLRKGRS
jgi:hypothetical protein